ncbi:hypothetical protein [Pseudarthrobacter sp. ATCC 49987]|uniref:hypothetical protein n=1 Tax=Pseudarthrobacter sp. ATCC 49987 TaxID=2698204 RepID=UPI00136FD067|nr:hypothetical protein [Pseudarthrobacter sp. ATCC 49987]
MTGALAERGMSIRDGLLVGDDAVSQYDGDPMGGLSLPLTSTESSQINAEFVYRGSSVATTNRITLPASTKETQTADAVESCVESMQSLNVRVAMQCPDAVDANAGRKVQKSRTGRNPRSIQKNNPQITL